MPRIIAVGEHRTVFTLPTEPQVVNALVWVDVGGFLNIDLDGGGGFSLREEDFERLTDVVPQNQDRVIEEANPEDDDEPLGPEEPDHVPNEELLMIDGGEDEEVLF